MPGSPDTFGKLRLSLMTLPSRSYVWARVRLPLVMLVGRLAASYPKVALLPDQVRPAI